MKLALDPFMFRRIPLNKIAEHRGTTWVSVHRAIRSAGLSAAIYPHDGR